jgi:CheY-like chemotaxis protein
MLLPLSVLALDFEYIFLAAPWFSFLSSICISCLLILLWDNGTTFCSLGGYVRSGSSSTTSILLISHYIISYSWYLQIKDPLLVVEEFKPHFYDLLLTDIYMPNMNGFELCEKILELDVNIKVCFMSALVVNIHALREVILVWFYIEFFVWDRTICKPPDQETIEKTPYGLSVPLGMRFNLLLYLI